MSQKLYKKMSPKFIPNIGSNSSIIPRNFYSTASRNFQELEMKQACPKDCPKRLSQILSQKFSQKFSQKLSQKVSSKLTSKYFIFQTHQNDQQDQYNQLEMEERKPFICDSAIIQSCVCDIPMIMLLEPISFRKWHFVTKILLTYCEKKKMFQ